MRDIHEAAAGKWRGILAACGVSAELIDGKHHPCPTCGGRDRFRFVDYEGTGGFICSKCGNGSGFDLLMKIRGWDFRTAAREVERVVGTCKNDPVVERSDAEKREAMNKLWRSAKMLTPECAAGRYLRTRCAVGAYPPSLRFVPALHASGATADYPAMLAKVTAPDGKPTNIHRTYLTEEGEKAPLDAPRRMMPGSIAKGAAVRLADPGAILGIAEGIETAFSASVMFNLPCWAALNAHMLETWEVPPGVERVVIFGDNDATFVGQAAAYALARRIASASLAVEIKIPGPIGDDWNDVHQRMKIAAMPAQSRGPHVATDRNGNGDEAAA